MTDTPKKKIVWIGSLAILCVLIFCVSFVFFYTRRQQQSAAASVGVETGQALPHADLIDDANQVMSDADLRKGRFILVFVTPDCDACLRESQFLRKAIAKRGDIPFYGVISFGEREIALRDAKAKFPFRVFYDQNFQLAAGLGIKRVPVKLFVENGVVKKSWGGATIAEDKQNEFSDWLESL